MTAPAEQYLRGQGLSEAGGLGHVDAHPRHQRHTSGKQAKDPPWPQGGDPLPPHDSSPLLRTGPWLARDMALLCSLAVVS